MFGGFGLSNSCSPGPKVMAKVVKRKGVDHRLWKGEEPGVVVAGNRGDRAFSSLKALSIFDCLWFLKCFLKNNLQETP